MVDDVLTLRKVLVEIVEASGYKLDLEARALFDQVHGLLGHGPDMKADRVWGEVPQRDFAWRVIALVVSMKVKGETVVDLEPERQTTGARLLDIDKD